MDHTVDVQPISVSVEVAKADVQFIDFQLNATDGYVQVLRYDKNDRFIDTTVVHIPPDIYSQWGTDDSIIIDYALEQLKMKELEHTVTKKPESSTTNKSRRSQKR